MEMANLDLVREATREDKLEITRLLQKGAYRHIHADWRLPLEWLGGGGFVVAQAQQRGSLSGCLAVGMDPPPAAWVRVAALSGKDNALPVLEKMLEEVLPFLATSGSTELAWIARSEWPAAWMYRLGFELVDEVESFVKKGLVLTDMREGNTAVRIRDIEASDLPELALIEERAFAPRWRHSAEALALGWRHAISFQVVELNQKIVGFQYSTVSEDEEGAHLVRLTVDPAMQKQGLGTVLLRAAFDSYRARGLKRVSLNTQADNFASKRLYERFGFESVGYRMPVWAQEVCRFELRDRA